MKKKPTRSPKSKSSKSKKDRSRNDKGILLEQVVAMLHKTVKHLDFNFSQAENTLMEIAFIISLVALAVALPGCIADSLTVIEKIRARRAQRLLKKSTKVGLDRIRRFKKSSHLQQIEERHNKKIMGVPFGTREEIINMLDRDIPLTAPGWLKKALSQDSLNGQGFTA